MSTPGPYSRSSTLLELSRTRTGRLLRGAIARTARKQATTPDEARLFAGATAYLTLEKLVQMSGGKLTWPVVDSLIDVANGKPGRVVGRAGRATKAKLAGVTGR